MWVPSFCVFAAAMSFMDPCMVITMPIWNPRVVTGSAHLAPPPRWNPSYLLALPGEFFNAEATYSACNRSGY